MSNVEYKCLEVVGHKADGEDIICGSRFYGLPGGTNHRCHQHDRIFEQVEEYEGPDFAYVDSSASSMSTSGNQTPGSKTQVIDASNSEKDRLRAEYRGLTEVDADMRWGEKRLKDEIAAAKADRHKEEYETTENVHVDERDQKVDDDVEKV